MIPSNSLLFSTGAYHFGNAHHNTSTARDTTSNTLSNQIQRLSPGQLLDHPFVKQLLHNQLIPGNISMKTTDVEMIMHSSRKLQEENMRLKQELHDRAVLLHPEPNQISYESPSPSLSPNDSISQVGRSPGSSEDSDTIQRLTLVDRQCSRPSHVPLAVFWHLQDCQSEPGIVTKGNESRPNMEKCIRYPDGTRIERHEWRSIMAITKAIIDEELRPLGGAEGILNTRTYYRKHFPQAWQTAVAKLEAEKPIMGFCAGHWKAEHTLAQLLLSKRSVEVRVARYNHNSRAPASEGTETSVPSINI